MQKQIPAVIRQDLRLFMKQVVENSEFSDQAMNELVWFKTGLIETEHYELAAELKEIEEQEGCAIPV